MESTTSVRDAVPAAGVPWARLDDLAASPPPPLSMAAGGHPVDPLLLVSGAEFELLEAPARRGVAAALRATRRCTVAVAGPGGRVPGELAQAVDLALTSAPEAADARTVSVPDVAATLAVLADRFAETPLASLSYVWLLRQSAGLPVPAALSAESAIYSALLAGPEFARWLEQRGPARPADDRSRRVATRRAGDVLHLRLVRPGRRNAVDAAMRDALLGGLAPAEWDPNLLVEIDAEGPAFSAGGDLDEFGSLVDPASAHVLRLGASVAEVLHRMRDRVTVQVHGTCLGAGFELPCFAGRVLAAPDTRLGLPELAMGLVPGAGGTVSIVRRTGRWRTAYLGLTGERVDVRTALCWGLVDAVVEERVGGSEDAPPAGGPRRSGTPTQ